jgi:pimeloyl-ACP methyl ester carboxylesterase
LATTKFVQTPAGKVAIHESQGGGPPLVLLHGNSSSARAFTRQLHGDPGRKRRLIAIDALGSGQSDNAGDIAAYLLPGQARTLVAAVEALGLQQAIFVGWSLGGHILLEASPELPEARGFAIFGTPPIAFPPAMDRAFLPNPAMPVGFTAEISREQAEAYVASFFAPGYTGIPPFFVEDALRTDPRARSQTAASIAPGGYRDEVAIVAGLKQPLAVLHGSEEQLVNGAYFADLAMPALWRGAPQIIAGAGHAPQWEDPAAFDALIDAFAESCA